MVFNSVAFIYFFLPIVLAVYYLIHRWPRFQNIWLLAASLFFYAWCNIEFLWFLLAFGVINYSLALLLHGSAEWNSHLSKRIVLIFALGFNVLSLFVVKYLNFSIKAANTLLKTSFSPVASIIVPLGISFLVFSMISYLLDIHWKKSQPIKDPVEFFLYLAFFPKISQGPITRCEQMRGELSKRTVTLEDFTTGFRRFCFGLAKKVLIADTLGASVDLVYYNLHNGIPVAAAWAGMLCYTFQIYFDFSGYTDMAIGLGRMFGFRLPENFNSPYLSKSVSEFWRRWHMTLGSWFRDYVYIPLGGNRRGNIRTYFNLAVVWLLTGLWHGAAYTYILWGIGLGAIIMLEKAVGKTRLYLSIPDGVKWFSCFLTIMFSWVLFRSYGVADAIRYFMAMFGVDACVSNAYGLRYFMDNGTLLALAAAIALCIPAPRRLLDQAEISDKAIAAKNICALFLLAFALLFMVNNTYNAFIYFQF